MYSLLFQLQVEKALRLVWRFGSCVSTGWIVNM